MSNDRPAFILQLKDTTAFRLVVLSWCILLIASRQTDLLVTPRLWAEEGKIFYSFARHHSFAEIFITPQVGYLTLFNSFISLLQARFFPVELAPAVSTYAGFAVQLIPVCIILFTTHPFWNTPGKKILVSLVLILATPPELWLNTTNSHFFFGLITFLIMVVPAAQLSTVKKWIFRSLLVVGNLTGPASMFFTPVFFLQARIEKSREKYIQAFVQLIFASVQAVVVVYSLTHQNEYHRLRDFEAGKTISNFFIDHFSLAVTVFSIPDRRNFGILMAAGFIFLAIARRKDREHMVFVLSFVICAVFSTAGSLHMEGSPRYGYITTCLLFVLVMKEMFALPEAQKKTAILPGTVFLFAFLMNIIYFKPRMEDVCSPDYPQWKQEVWHWRTDPHYTPRIHPSYNDTWWVQM